MNTITIDHAIQLISIGQAVRLFMKYDDALSAKSKHSMMQVVGRPLNVTEEADMLTMARKKPGYLYLDVLVNKFINWSEWDEFIFAANFTLDMETLSIQDVIKLSNTIHDTAKPPIPIPTGVFFFELIIEHSYQSNETSKSILFSSLGALEKYCEAHPNKWQSCGCCYTQTKAYIRVVRENGNIDAIPYQPEDYVSSTPNAEIPGGRLMGCDSQEGTQTSSNDERNEVSIEAQEERVDDQ